MIIFLEFQSSKGKEKVKQNVGQVDYPAKEAMAREEPGQHWQGVFLSYQVLISFSLSHTNTSSPIPLFQVRKDEAKAAAEEADRESRRQLAEREARVLKLFLLFHLSQ